MNPHDLRRLFCWFKNKFDFILERKGIFIKKPMLGDVS